MTFEVFLAAMLTAALVSLTVLFSRSSEEPTYLRQGGKKIRWDPPTQFQSGSLVSTLDGEVK